MRVLEFIREKREQFQKQNAEFIAKLEPQFKNLSDKVTQTLANTLNNPWVSFFKPSDDGDDEPRPLVLSPEAAKVYQELQEQLGEETFVGEWLLVDQKCINQFAEVTGDKQWIHTDAERAAEESPFKTTIAHGFLTLSLIPALTDTVNSDNNPYPDAKMVVNYGLNQVRFPFPVKSGSRVRARTRLIGLTPMKRSIEIVNEVSIEVENSKRLACVAETVLRLYF
ncbi:MaoC family dehydratase [Pleionea litopenaei]|uniref:MaoC family dehydratase n=1 Tax=Pleionea litopenaei TaxID=3070815 RepID=A0AA51RQE9_9GAMM|nr:MaoC family dehydratase [Pleionea sp. HL-JVS1]WMS85737.1 MaoC family dehydratase [Pleionea sp. HL-JVS1]